MQHHGMLAEAWEERARGKNVFFFVEDGLSRRGCRLWNGRKLVRDGEHRGDQR